MHQFRNFLVIGLLGVFSAGSAQPQDGTSPTKHFEKDGLTFNYPADWIVTENNSPGLHIVTVAPADSATQILVSTYRGPVPSCDYELEGKKIAGDFSKRVATVLKSQAGTDSPVTTQVGGSDMTGTQFQGLIEQRPALGDVYAVRLNRQFLSLVFVRRVDDSIASSAWQTVRSSLEVEPPVTGTTSAPPGESSRAAITGGVLNGKALSLSRPDYPPIARSAHASGVVVVQVTIDESGKVIAAHAVSGHPLLQGVSVAAAKQAKFSPTKLCGEPVKVTGVITYNFVAR